MGAGSAETKLFWQALALPGLQKNQRFQRELAEGARTAIVKRPDGEVLGKVPVIRWDVNTHDRTIARIARGLYYHEFRTVLSHDTPISTHYMQELDAEMREVFSAGQIRQVGTAFEYSVLRVDDDPKATMWLFNFYSGRHVAVAATGQMALDDDGED
ncbi:hypothetical protein [Azospirillum halopraeferens]|uniref:hypothetical protein n=1 Tax=Azospirillum halopraeferens TaxID=34010 RepID=UPI0012EC59C2|nr:hypothetical protein [Azospirillum halopraeferens]